jgi:valyl-tRNA synthetase
MGKYFNLMLSQASTEDNSALIQMTGPLTAEELASLPLPERALIHSLHTLVTKVTQNLESFALGEAGQLIYEFVWDQLADWHVEISKTRMRDPVSAKRTQRVLVYAWETSLRLLHPYVPFVTETLWQQLPRNKNTGLDSIMLADWPLMRRTDALEGEEEELLALDPVAAQTFEQLQRLVRSIRNLRAEYKTEPGRKLPVAIRVSISSSEGKQLFSTLQTESAALSLLARLDETAIHLQLVTGSLKDTVFAPPQGFGKCVQVIVDEGVDAYLPLTGMIDTEKEVQRINKQIDKLAKDTAGLEARLGSPGFADKAPPTVVAEVQGTLKEKQEQIAVLRKSLADMAVQQ